MFFQTFKKSIEESRSPRRAATERVAAKGTRDRWSVWLSKLVCAECVEALILNV